MAERMDNDDYRGQAGGHEHAGADGQRKSPALALSG
jgi:hypothetical protein